MTMALLYYPILIGRNWVLIMPAKKCWNIIGLT